MSCIEDIVIPNYVFLALFSEWLTLCVCILSILFHWSVHLVLHYYLTILITVDLYYTLETKSVVPLSLFFKTALAI